MPSRHNSAELLPRRTPPLRQKLKIVSSADTAHATYYYYNYESENRLQIKEVEVCIFVPVAVYSQGII